MRKIVVILSLNVESCLKLGLRHVAVCGSETRNIVWIFSHVVITIGSRSVGPWPQREASSDLRQRMYANVLAWIRRELKYKLSHIIIKNKPYYNYIRCKSWFTSFVTPEFKIYYFFRDIIDRRLFPSIFPVNNSIQFCSIGYELGKS